jgi:hypothetical protein
VYNGGMKKCVLLALMLTGAFFLFTDNLFAQTRKKTTPKAKKTVTKKTTTEPVSSVTAPPPAKKNERPEETSAATGPQEPQKKNQSANRQGDGQNTVVTYPYSYEFTQPEFLVSRYVIEHDDKGKGKIVFEKKESDEQITDPVQLTSVTMARLNEMFQKLNFLDSTEEYQSKERQYGHLGNHKITLRLGGKTRTVLYNWSENKDAKALADEYRKIGEQYIWIFDINLSRENQPLEAPGLMDKLDSLIRRKEISDPPQMIPFLTELSDDERIPLIARNKAKKIIKELEKAK